MIVARHELLRATIAVIDGVPHATVHDDWPLRFEKIDLSALPAAQRELEMQRLLTEKPRALYNLESEPGIRVALVQLSNREHVLILMMHHIVCDWSSEGIIWRELSALYRSLIGGQPATLPPLAITHGDYATWRQKRIADEDFAADLAFWEEKLRDAPALLEVPADRVRPTVMSYRGNRLRWKLDSAITEKLRHASQQEKVSLFTIFAAALNSLLYRYTGSDDILLGIPLADRDQQELQSVVGFLLHTHVLRTRIAGNMSFRELLGSVQKGALELYAHRDAPFDQIVRRLGQERSPGHSPLFQVMLNWRDRDQQLSFIGMDGLAVESLLAHSNTAKFDLLLFATDEGEEIWLEMEYNADLFDEDRITRMLGHYQAVLESATADPAQAVNHLEILPAAERRQVLYERNATAAPYDPDTFVQRLIEAQVARTPAATALVFEDAPLSYAELNARANRLAHHLRAMGVKPDARVAVCAERSFEMVIALLATLKAGGAYVPFDPTFPAERLQFMIEDAAPVVLLTQTHLKALFSTLNSASGLDRALPVIDLADATAWSQMPASNPDPEAIGLAPQHLAYVIYTSGSTGKPKGVMVEHRNVVNFFTGMDRAIGCEPGVWLAVTSMSFDISVLELHWTLARGFTVVVHGEGGPAAIADEIARYRVTHLQMTPSLARMLTLDPHAYAALGSLKQMLLGGEAVPAALIHHLRQVFKGEIHNMYGPTETTVWSTTCRVGDVGTTVSIGRPIANTRIYILDTLGQPAPAGVPGELYIAGVSVARGYLNRPELTAERFLADPFTTGPDARMYRTGDLCRWMSSGNIEYVGRNDFQVKIRGFRIELGEIENELLRYPGVRQCVVTAQGSDAEKQLVAYLVPADAGSAPSVDDLRATLQRRLPSYMVPSVFAFIYEIPLTPNGKADIRKLMQSEVKAAQRETPAEAPRDGIEAELVEIWERVLNVRPIGVHDNFFEIGGHSLAGVRLLDKIKKTYRIDLELADLFEASSVRHLSAFIDKALHQPSAAQKDRSTPVPAPVDRSMQDLSMTPGVEGQARQISELPDQHGDHLIVPVQDGSPSRPSFFMIHAYHLYPVLPQRLGSDQAFYGIQEYEPGEWVGEWSLEPMMARYVQAIRTVQPHGPYFIGGFCSSAIPAFEVARQLQEANETVLSLILIDPVDRLPFSNRVDLGPGEKRSKQWFRIKETDLPPDAGILVHLKTLAAEKSRRALARAKKWWYSRLVRLCMRWGLQIPAFLGRKLVNGIRIVTLEATRNYTLRQFSGDIDIFLSDDYQSLANENGSSPWAQHTTGDVKFTRVHGDHLSAFRLPKIDEFAQQLRSALDEAIKEYRDALPASMEGTEEAAEGTEGVDMVWTPGNHETMFLEGNEEMRGQLVRKVMDRASNGSGAVPAESARALNAVPQ